MATRYVSNNPAGSNTSPYDTLAKAATTFATAITGAAAGDVFAFSNLHSESLSSATTFTLPGTAASPNQMFSFDNTQTTISGSNLLAGATLSTTANNNLTLTGVCSECNGFTLAAGTGANTAILTVGVVTGLFHVVNCALQKPATSAGQAGITLGGGNQSQVILDNTTVQFGSTGDGLRVSGNLWWKNTPNAIQGATIPTTLINTTTVPNTIFCEGVDFHALTNGTLLQNNIQSVAVIKDCKLAATTLLALTPTSQSSSQIFGIRSGSAAGNNSFTAIQYEGTETQETTITRVGGAATPDGNLFSGKIVTTANIVWGSPFVSMPLSVWNTITGSSRTVTIYGTINSASLPNNDEIWIEAEYLKDASDPLGGFVNSTKANSLASGVAVSSDSSTWNGGGSGAGWSPFKLTVTLTAQQTGPITVRVFAGKASTTYYFDPHINLS